MKPFLIALIGMSLLLLIFGTSCTPKIKEFKEQPEDDDMYDDTDDNTDDDDDDDDGGGC